MIVPISSGIMGGYDSGPVGVPCTVPVVSVAAAASRTATQLLISLGLTLFGNRTLGAQATTLIGNEPACRSCRIVVERARLLRAPSSGKPLSRGTFAAAGPAGGYLLSNRDAAEAILEYDGNGGFVRAIGRFGGGPGEFKFLDALAIGPGDTIHAFGTHHTVFDPAGRAVRAEIVPYGARIMSAVVLPNNELVLQSMVQAPELVGKPLHLVSARNAVLASFGERPGSAYRGAFWENFRAIALSTDHDVWAAPPNEYRIEKWTTHGDLVGTVVRRPPWFVPWETWSGNPARDRPPTIVSTISEDAEALLWVVSSVPDAHWAPLTTAPEGREGRPFEAGDFNRLYDSVIDVIDAKSGRFLATQKFDEDFQQFVRPGQLWSYSESLTDGEVAIVIWHTKLLRWSKPKSNGG